MNISDPVVKKDHSSKMNGQAIYVADYSAEGMLFGKLLHSQKARARILDIRLPDLPEGYFVVDRNDIPGDNNVNIVLDDTPVFARDTVEYAGDAILMAVGPDENETERLMNEIEVVYEDLPAVLNIRDFDTVFFDYSYGKGDVEKAFAEADKVYEEQFETGYQEQAYLETQGMIAEPYPDKIAVHGSMQCPYYVKGAVARVMACRPDQVRIMQDATGGGFGGKEAYPSILACQAAVAARKAGKPVKVIFSRREDMEFTSKRHPSLCTYKAAVKNGRVTAMDIDVLFNAGAYTTLSPVVLQRGIICADGVYNIENLKVRGRAVKTNLVPSGAFRGFGGPQTFFAVETVMDHIAGDLGVDSVRFKLDHVVKRGDMTSTSGRYHFPVPIPQLVETVLEASDFMMKRRKYLEPQTGRFRYGVGMSMIFHGAGFTGSGERDHIKAVAKLHKLKSGDVEILVSNTDIGQGIKTALSKIVANELELPIDRVAAADPDTDRVPDSGPTVASRSVMIVGELLRRAAIRLRETWAEGEEQLVEEHFTEPDFLIPFYLDKFQGDAYPTYSWGVNAIEIEVDTLTGTPRVLGAWGCYDVGTPIDRNIVAGQMEGGLLQGIGYASMEQMTSDEKGRIRNNSYSDYMIPTSMDVPELKVILHAEKYPEGPYGAKGAGELPLVGVPGAYVEAVEQALNMKLHKIPVTSEDIVKAFGEASI